MEQKEKTERKIIKFSLKKFNRLLIILIAVCGVYYVAGTNNLSTKGFKLHELKKAAIEIDRENKDLEARITVLDSYDDINKRIEKLGMVKAGNAVYMSGSSAVARR